VSGGESTAEEHTAETEAVLSLQRTLAAEATDEDEVVAHSSGLSVYRCIDNE
jgi:hypothetical protein